MRIVTWNINSVRLRLPLLARMAEELKPDIICLQETKVEDGLFPLAQVQAMGFGHVYFSGQKSYHGVAILSRIPLEKVNAGCMGGSSDKRHISGLLPDGTQLHNFYIPAGGDIADPAVNDKFAFKLHTLRKMVEWGKTITPKDKVIFVGDINVAPLPTDVWSHKQLLTVVSHTPAETELMEALRDTQGFVDAVRHFIPAEQKLYSWWSYRNRDWEKSDRGRRLDHIWVTPNLKNRLKEAYIHKPMRRWESPSDHVPVVLDVE